MKIAIVGSRNWMNARAIHSYIDTLPTDTVIVSGGARGVDQIAESHAKMLGLETKIFLADWNRYGKSAGIRRNAEIVSYADTIVYFWDGQSSGTKNTIDRAIKAGKPVVNGSEIIIPAPKPVKNPLLFLDPDLRPTPTNHEKRVRDAIRDYDASLTARRTDDTLRKVARNRTRARFAPVIAGTNWFPGWCASAGDTTDYVSVMAEFARLRSERDSLRALADSELKAA